MKILITGGAGFIGSFLAERCLAEGHQVRIVDNLEPQVHPEGQPHYVPPEADVMLSDVRDIEALAAALDDVDVVVHCAAAVGVAQSLYRIRHYADVNVVGIATLLELLVRRSRPLHRLIVLTSMTMNGEGEYRRPSDGRLMRVPIRTEQDIRRYGWEMVCPDTGERLEPVPTPEDAAFQARNIYALTKRYQEELALSVGRTFDLPVVCLRLFNVYGPRQSLSNPYTGVLAIFLSRLLADQAPVVYEDGQQTRDFVAVHDVVNAVMQAVQRDEASGHVINIGSGVPRRIGECARTLAHLMHRDDIEPTIGGQFRAGDIRHCIADITNARRQLGYAPQVTWEAGLADLPAWARSVPSVDQFDTAQRELQKHGLISTKLGIEGR
jgi:dTDP-L-rhamnose 4-epimerase